MGTQLISLLLLLSCITAGVLAVYTWRRRSVLKTVALPGLLLSLAIWALAATLEVAATTLEGKQFLTIVGFVGIIVLPVFLFLFSIDYTNTPLPFSQFARIAIWVVPVVSFIVLLTNPGHGLFYSNSELKYSGTIAYHFFSIGAWWWVNLVYSYLLTCTAIVLFIQRSVHAESSRRKQAHIMLVASLIPLVSSILFLLGVKPYGFIDTTPIAYAVSGFLFVWGLTQANLFNYKPVVLQTLFDCTPDGIIILDWNGNLTEVNATTQRIFKLNELGNSDVINRTLLEPLNIRTKNNLNLFTKIYGSTYNVIVNTLQVEKGDRAGKLILLRNVNESIKIQRELTTAQSRLELAAKVAGLDPWENNLKTGMAQGGDQIYFELGYAPPEVPKSIEEFFTFIHPDDLPVVKKRLQDHIGGKTNFYTSDFRIRNKWGEYRWVANFGMVSERDEEGKAVSLVGLTMNINERKKTEEKIKKQNEELLLANAEKDKFFSILAHDLRSPFQGFIALTELINQKLGAADPEELVSISQTLQLSIKNIYELLENLLSWAMIKRGSKKFNPEKLRFAPLVHSAIELLKPQILSKEHTIHNHIGAGLTVLADRESMKTVIRNLLSNAIKFTPKGGSISVLYHDPVKGFFEIGVSDNGIGMPEEILTNLFNIHSKVSRPGTSNEPSTGLGLILCKELIEKHGGKIWVESAPGTGTTIWFMLPSGS